MNRRLLQEIGELQRNPPLNITAGPIDENNIFHLQAMIFGPTDSPYAGGMFKLDINVPEKYPFRPPSIKFITKIYHVNISMNGDICLDILKHNWSPVLKLEAVLLSILSLLTDPNPNDPLNASAAEVYRNDPQVYNHMAESYTVQYAMGYAENETEIRLPPSPPDVDLLVAGSTIRIPTISGSLPRGYIQLPSLRRRPTLVGFRSRAYVDEQEIVHNLPAYSSDSDSDISDMT